jgi:hypothetical protein
MMINDKNILITVHNFVSTKLKELQKALKYLHIAKLCVYIRQDICTYTFVHR